MKRTSLAALGLMAAGSLVLAGCGSSTGDPLAGPTAGSSTSAAAAGSVIVGSANFPENELIAEIYAGALRAKGVTVSTKLNIGNRETYVPALKDGSIDLIPEYTGNLALYFNKSAAATDPAGVYAEAKAALPDGLTILDKAAAEDKDSVVVTKATADKYKLASIADLAPVAKDLVIGGPPEWKVRATGIPGLKKVYGLTFKEFKPLDVAGPLSVNALKNGQVDVVNLFTTQSAISVNGFVALQDPKSLFAAQNVVPLITTSKVTATVSAALNAVSAKLDTATLLGLVKTVEADKKDASAVAAQWLTSAGLG